jgi:type IV pilus assembly protein PilM
MANQPGVWGLEVGQCAFKAIRLEAQGDEVVATNFDYIEHPKILSQPDADPDQLTREALAKFLERNSVRGDTVNLGVPGQSGLARFVKLPPVEEKKINDIVRFEAKQQIPFPLEEVIWDFQKIGSGIVTDGFAMETEIGLFAMKRDMIQRALTHFLEANVEVHVIQMAPLALCNYMAYDLLGSDGGKKTVDDKKTTNVKEKADKTFKRKCIVALDIGADGSTLVITDADRIIWQRSIPPGGNHFTRALTKEMKLTFAKAEHLKRNATKSPDLKRILAALKPVLNEFVGEVQRSLNYFTNTHRDAHIEYMIGLGNAFRLPGLQKFLAEKLQLDVRKLQKLENAEGDSVLSDPVFSNNVLSFATVYGLALQGLKKGRIQTNLLPPDIQFARMIRAKKPWAVAAAAALLVGFTGTALGYKFQHDAIYGEEVRQAKMAAQALAKQAADFESEFNRKKAEVEANQAAIKSLMAGKEERLNWVLLNRFVNDCLPVPALRVDGKVKKGANNKYSITDADGKSREFTIDARDKSYIVLVGNQPTNPLELKDGQEVAIVYQDDPGAKKYWDTPAAKNAYFQYWNRLVGGKGMQSNAGDEGVEDLIEIKLESVDALYCTDLPIYFSNVQNKKDFADGMPNTAQATAPPAGKGWVVELRGYTYNQKRRQFVYDTLVSNLSNRAIQGDQAFKAWKEAQTNAAANPAAAPDPAADPTAKEGEKKEGDKKKAPPPPPDVDPKPHRIHEVVGSHVSHVVLYEYNAVPDPQSGKFQLIEKSVLPELVRPTGRWSSLMAGGLAGGGGAGGRGEMGGGPGMPGRHPPPPGPAPANPNAVPPEGGVADDARKGLRRTEFVVLFIWQEPLSKDNDFTGDASAVPEGGMPGGMPGGPAGAPMPAPAPAPGPAKQ